MQIKVKNLIETLNLDQNIVASALYSSNINPIAALRRVYKGEAMLNEEQIVKLSELTGFTIAQLFEFDNAKVEKVLNEIYVKLGPVEATLNIDTMHLSVFKDSIGIIHETVILKTAITVNELIEYINTISKS